MQTTMLWSAGVFSTATRWSPTRALMAHGADRLGAIIEQRPFESRIAPRSRDDARPVVRADLGLVGFDNAIERGRIDITLLGQHRFERAYAQLHLGQVRTVLVIDDDDRRVPPLRSVHLLCATPL